MQFMRCWRYKHGDLSYYSKKTNLLVIESVIGYRYQSDGAGFVTRTNHIALAVSIATIAPIRLVRVCCSCALDW